PNDITETKIIIAGVENAGKTSVLQSIREMKTMDAERPTKGMSTEVLSFAGYNLSTWDLGGQKTFRDQYFNNPDLFLRTSVFFYVVDIQDDDRISDSFDYFSRLIQILKYLQEKPMLAILLHKFDPEIRGPIIEQKTWHIKEDFREIIQKIQFEEPLFFKTSIYDLISLTKSLSTTFSKMSPVSEIIVSTLGHFSTQRNQALSCLLFAENGLIISEFISGEMPKDTKDVIMFESMCLIREFNKDPTLEKLNEIHEINGYMLRLYPIPVGRNTSVILAVISHIDEKDREKAVRRLILEEGEESMQEQLTPWIQSFFRLF
ncbi:MAG: ADP-ribosylation factor-like protein, partial [Promethearchaeota archaeon]